ncbi:hypothetical protein [Aestuariivirga sp.]|uniref:hypothetical protein n=1 Tax=Aestuariivirga sp. TaxID=2650926 RepID=UPI003593E185
MKDMLDCIDHINKTKDLTEALFMAAESVGSEDGAALTALSSVIIDRLEEAKALLKAMIPDAEGKSAA